MQHTQKYLIVAVMASMAAAACTSPPPAGSEAAKFAAEEKTMQRDSTNMPTMSAAQSAQYRAEYQTAKAKWGSLTPQEKAAAVASARQKKIMDLTATERVAQNDDMTVETAAQSAALRAEADAARAAWDKMTPAQKQAVRRTAWTKKRAELTAVERVAQNDDTDILPW
jgi:predicted Fe-S protein YdhL (DUF1289 family)